MSSIDSKAASVKESSHVAATPAPRQGQIQRREFEGYTLRVANYYGRTVFVMLSAHPSQPTPPSGLHVERSSNDRGRKTAWTLAPIANA